MRSWGSIALRASVHSADKACVTTDPTIRQAQARKFIEALPHCRALAMAVDNVGDGEATMSMPYDEKLIGDPATGVIHGGAVSALMDTCCGAAVMSPRRVTPASAARGRSRR